MRELTPDTITNTVLEQMATTPDPRPETITAAAVNHLHAFAGEVNLTPAKHTSPIEGLPRGGADPSASLNRVARGPVPAGAG